MSVRPRLELIIIPLRGSVRAYTSSGLNAHAVRQRSAYTSELTTTILSSHFMFRRNLIVPEFCWKLHGSARALRHMDLASWWWTVKSSTRCWSRANSVICALRCVTHIVTFRFDRTFTTNTVLMVMQLHRVTNMYSVSPVLLIIYAYKITPWGYLWNHSSRLPTTAWNRWTCFDHNRLSKHQHR